MNSDAELKAMTTCFEVVSALPVDAQKRVISWLTGRFGSPQEHKTSALNDEKNASRKESHETKTTAETEGHSSSDFAELFSKANPKTAADKVLFAAWFISEKMGQKEFKSLTINGMLTPLGHKPASVSVEVARLVAAKPALMLQTRKEGKAKQARKLLKISEAGKVAAKKMLEASPENDA
jgi:hypothetical protein